jgi:hypothetical protein
MKAGVEAGKSPDQQLQLEYARFAGVLKGVLAVGLDAR